LKYGIRYFKLIIAVHSLFVNDFEILFLRFQIFIIFLYKIKCMELLLIGYGFVPCLRLARGQKNSKKWLKIRLFTVSGKTKTACKDGSVLTGFVP